MDKKLLIQKARIVSNVPVDHVPGAYKLEDDKVRYVGSTQDLRRRALNHASHLQRGSHSNKSLQAHSDASKQPLRFIPIPTQNKDQALSEEQALLNEHMQDKNLTNVHPSAYSSKGKAVPQEVAARYAANMRAANLGREVSIETRAKLSIKGLGNKRALGSVRTTEQRESTSKTKGTPVTVHGVAYRSYNHAAQELNVSPQTVLNRCNSDTFTEWTRG